MKDNDEMFAFYDKLFNNNRLEDKTKLLEKIIITFPSRQHVDDNHIYSDPTWLTNVVIDSVYHKRYLYIATITSTYIDFRQPAYDIYGAPLPENYCAVHIIPTVGTSVADAKQTFMNVWNGEYENWWR